MVENTPQYVAYTREINAVSKEIRDFEKAKDEKLAQILYLEEERLPELEGWIASWLAAGSSDKVTRDNKIAHYRKLWNEGVANVERLKLEVSALEESILVANQRLDEIEALQAGYVNAYNDNITKGISPNDAAELAKEEMEIQTAEGLFTKSRNTLFIIGGAIALIAIITIIIIFKKK